MASTRTTVYLHPKVYRAAKIKSAATGKSFTEIVNDALILSLKEDEADLAAFDHRTKEPSRPFESALKDLKRDGLL
ncbi:MAG: CopG family transcriptional regulator [Elusimicrobia bacterium]|nr:CopG family transcriptional regulator [Elusimicrobiota bacterium]